MFLLELEISAVAVQNIHQNNEKLRLLLGMNFRKGRLPPCYFEISEANDSLE